MAGNRVTATSKKAFLDGIADGHGPVRAAQTAGHGHRTMYDLRDRDEAFKAEWARAAKIGAAPYLDVLLDAAAGRIKVTQQQLTACFGVLKWRRPAEFRDNAKIEHTGPGGGPQKVEVTLTDDDARSALRGLADAGLVHPGGTQAPDAEG